MDKGGRARSPTKPGRAELWRLGALAALGAWTIVIPYLGHAFGLGVDVPSKKEIVDHFVPGASVLLDTLEATQAAGPALWRREHCGVSAGPLRLDGAEGAVKGEAEPNRIGESVDRIVPHPSGELLLRAGAWCYKHLDVDRPRDRSDATGTKKSLPGQYEPQLALAPDGRLDVLYHDRRHDPANVMNSVSLQSSFDHGHSFTRAIQLPSRTFSSRIGCGACEGLPDLGSHLGLVSCDSSAVGVWTDTSRRNGADPEAGHRAGDGRRAATSTHRRHPDPAGLLAAVAGLALTGGALAGTIRNPTRSIT